jgi:PadR family transcriptional regulator, regulatory protein PadR
MLRSQLLKGTTELLILSVLEEEELHGYQILQRIRERSDDALAPSEGTLYPALHRLEQRGALDASWGPGEAGPRRRYYRLTDAGVGLLAEARQDWNRYVSEVRLVAGALAPDGDRG